MNITTFKKSISYLFKADVPAFVWGHHGIGKSTVPRKWCEENGWKFFDFRLNTQADIGDFLGLQDFVKDEKGNVKAVKHYPPEWLVSSIEFCKQNPDKGTLVFMDELNRAARFDMIGPVFQMSLDKRLHTIEFPPNLKLMFASNPNTEDYNILDLNDKALMDRFIHIPLIPLRKEFFEYARERKVDERIINFLLENPSFIEETDLQEFSVDDIVKPSRRTWVEYIDKLVKVGTPDDILQELLKGGVGITISTAFFKYLENDDKPLSPEDVLNDYKKNKNKIQKFMDNKEGVRADILKVTLENVFAYLKKLGEDNKTVSKKQGENLIDYLLDIPSDLTYSFLVDAFILPSCLDFFDNTSYRIKELEEAVSDSTKNKEENNKKQKKS